MTPVKFSAQMRALIEQYGDDEESCHWHCDQLICQLLRELGYGEAVDMFEATERWYA